MRSNCMQFEDIFTCETGKPADARDEPVEGVCFVEAREVYDVTPKVDSVPDETT